MAEKIKLGSNGNFGVKEGGTLAYNDENGVFKAIELASSRASSGTYVAESGLIADAEVGVPRIDWTNGVGELLLEPQRRNLLPYSEDFTQPDWTGTSTATLSASTTICPDGTQSAVKVTATGASQDLREIVSVTSGQNYSSSIWIRRVTGSGNVYLIGVDGVLGSPLSLTSEWQRFETNVTSVDTNGRFYVRVATSGDEIECWGAQLEDNGVLGGGDYMTSYIRTSGSAVTRIADAVTGNSSLGQVINSSEGVLYFEGSFIDNVSASSKWFGLTDGTSNNRVLIYQTSGTNKLRCLVAVGGVNEFLNSDVLSGTGLNVSTTLKIALKWKANDFAIWVNGTEIDSQLSGNSFSSGVLNKLSLDIGTGGADFEGRVRELKVYDTALTDAQLQTLTTI